MTAEDAVEVEEVAVQGLPGISAELHEVVRDPGGVRMVERLGPGPAVRLREDGARRVQDRAPSADQRALVVAHRQLRVVEPQRERLEVALPVHVLGAGGLRAPRGQRHQPGDAELGFTIGQHRVDPALTEAEQVTVSLGDDDSPARDEERPRRCARGDLRVGELDGSVARPRPGEQPVPPVGRERSAFALLHRAIDSEDPSWHELEEEVWQEPVVVRTQRPELVGWHRDDDDLERAEAGQVVGELDQVLDPEPRRSVLAAGACSGGHPAQVDHRDVVVRKLPDPPLDDGGVVVVRQDDCFATSCGAGHRCWGAGPSLAPGSRGVRRRGRRGATPPGDGPHPSRQASTAPGAVPRLRAGAVLRAHDPGRAASFARPRRRGRLIGSGSCRASRCAADGELRGAGGGISVAGAGPGSSATG